MTTLRRLFILAVLSIAAWSQQPAHQPQRPPQQAQQPASAPAQAPIVVQVQMPQTPHFLPQTLVDWAQVSLVVLTAATLVVLCIYTWATLKSVKAAQDGAKAALLNAQAVINAERPWLLVSIEAQGYEPNTFIVKAFNAGRTPAELHEGHCTSEIRPINFIPTTDFRDPFRLPMQSLIVSRDGFLIRMISPGELVEQVGREGLDPQLCVYGRILYWGVFNDRTAAGAKPYETRWIFRYEPLKRDFTKGTGGYAGNT